MHVSECTHVITTPNFPDLLIVSYLHIATHLSDGKFHSTVMPYNTGYACVHTSDVLVPLDHFSLVLVLVFGFEIILVSISSSTASL